MPLFVVTKEGSELEESQKQIIKKVLRETYSPRHVPDQIIQVSIYLIRFLAKNWNCQ
jgi:acetoacetyl-CoA synthetase